MQSRVANVIVRRADGPQFANTLVLGRGVPTFTNLDGYPEIPGNLMPSGGDDTAAITAWLNTAGANVPLGAGTFRVSAPLPLGTARAITGAGMDATIIQASHAGPVFRLTADNVRIENLTVRGPGEGVANTVGIANAPAVPGGPVSQVTLRGLKIRDVQKGMTLKGNGLEISGIVVTLTGTLGIEVTNSNGVHISDVEVDNISGNALYIDRVTALTLTGLTAENCTTGIYVTYSHALHIAGSRMLNGGHGVTIDTSSLAELSGVEAAGCGTGFLIRNCAATALNGCGTVHGSGNSLTVRGGTFGGSGIAVTGYYAEMSYSTTPFMVVDGGAMGVMINSIHHRGSTTSAWDVDVTAAGERVVFIQHDFTDPTRINSGGKFVAL